MTKTQVFDKDGRPVTLEDGVLRDGQVLRVPIAFMDSAFQITDSASRSTPLPALMHRPGYAMFDGQQQPSNIGYQQFVDRLQNAWRNDAAPQQQAATSKLDAYEARVTRISDGWKGAAA